MVRLQTVCAISDQDGGSGIRWNNGSNTTTGATGTAIGTGQANTTAIISSQGAGSYAAIVCDNYTADSYSDWFLPSKDELDLLYQQKAVVGGFASTYYWSSSEYNSNSAWTQHFFNGNQVTLAKVNSFRVRAVRAF